MVYSLNQIAIAWIILVFHTFISHFEDKYGTHEIKKKEGNIITQEIKMHCAWECTSLIN